ncbi:MAG: DUF4340 domain-containing protein, partial [Bacteroidales bacterium]|nr:DUF4340 domain-containing protein [Candidatus Colimorpha onthohippi]
MTKIKSLKVNHTSLPSFLSKRNIIIYCVVIVLGIVALVVTLNGSKDATFEQDFHISDTSTVSRIFLADKNNHIADLVRTINSEGDTCWTVDNGEPASQPLVDLLLETLNTMRIRQQVNKNAIANIIKDISASSVKVEVYQEGYFINWFNGALKLFPRQKLTNTYFVGRETQDQMATFMYREGDKVPYVIHIPGFRGNITPRFTTVPYAWRSHQIVALNVQAIERIELAITDAPNESFAVYRQGDDFAMERTATHAPVQFDTARVAQLILSMKNLNFDEYAAVVPNSNMDTSFREGERSILTITDTAGVSHQVKT